MSQNRQSYKDRPRADIDYQLNLKNELALNEIIERLKTLERDYLSRPRINDRNEDLLRPLDFQAETIAVSVELIMIGTSV